MKLRAAFLSLALMPVVLVGACNDTTDEGNAVIAYLGDDSIFTEALGKEDGRWTHDEAHKSAVMVVASGKNHAYISSDGKVFSRQSTSDNWCDEDTEASDIDISGNELVILRFGQVYTKAVCSGQWKQESGVDDGTAVAISGQKILFLRSDGAVYGKNGDSDWVQEAAPGSATMIDIGDSGGFEMYANADDAFSRPSGDSNWHRVASRSAIAGIAVGGGSQMLVSAYGSVYVKPITWLTEAGWTLLFVSEAYRNVAVSSIAISETDLVLLRYNDGSVWSQAKWNFDSLWVQHTGSVDSITSLIGRKTIAAG